MEKTNDPIITMRDLKMNFGDKEVLRGINLDVYKGQIIGYIGPNGAGKSTTIKLIMNLLKKDGGDIKVFGLDNIKNEKEVKNRIGFVYDENYYYEELSIAQMKSIVASFYSKWDDNTFNYYINEFDLNPKAKIKTLSKGMKMKFSLSLALSHHADFIIMDEPTVGIDPQSRNNILEFTKELNKKHGSTLIYTSHYMEEAEELCTRISIMDKGKIISSGTKDELIGIINGKERIILSFDNINEVLMGKIKEISSISKVEVNGAEISIITTNTDLIFKDLISKINNTGCQVLSIDIKKPNLETVFLHLTGRALRD